LKEITESIIEAIFYPGGFIMQVNTNYAAQPAYDAANVQSAQTRARTGNDYLQDLKARYPQANISARDFAGAGDIRSYAAGKSGEFNDVAISPEALDKFANDPAAAAEMEALLQEFLDAEPRARALAESLGATDAARGMVVDKNGEATFWMSGTVKGGADNKEPSSIIDRLLKNPSAAERRKKLEEKRKENAAEEERIEEKRAKERREREEMLKRTQRTLFAATDAVGGLTGSFADKLNDGGSIDISV
jgi:hypothetical protein